MNALGRFIGRTVEHVMTVVIFWIMTMVTTAFIDAYGRNPRTWPVWIFALLMAAILVVGALLFHIASFWVGWLRTRYVELTPPQPLGQPPFQAANDNHTRLMVAAIAGAVVMLVAVGFTEQRPAVSRQRSVGSG